MSQQYTSEDPVDTVTYIISSNWNKDNYRPIPTIMPMHKKPTLQLTGVDKSGVRPYLLNATYESTGWGLTHENQRFIIAIDIQTLSRKRLIDCFEEVRRTLHQSRLNPDPTNKRYHAIYAIDYQDLSQDTVRIFHIVYNILLRTYSRGIVV